MNAKILKQIVFHCKQLLKNKIKNPCEATHKYWVIHAGVVEN
jgi:hypothetical protein